MKAIQCGRKLGLVLFALGAGTLLAAPTRAAAQASGSLGAGLADPPAAVAVSAESNESVSTEPGTQAYGLLPNRPRVTPTRADQPPDVDGALDDEIWATAAHITEFTQESPIEGAPATEDTDVLVAYDANNLYFGFHVHYRDPTIMRANRVQRDRAMQDDLVTVYLDTFLDQQRGYDFDVNAYGVQGDGIMTAGGGFGGGGGRSGGRGGGGGGRGGGGGGIPPADRSWDTLFETAGQLVEDGYTAEMAIPFKSLRYPSRGPGETQRWGLQIVREVKGKNQESQVWSPMSRGESSFFAQMGLLEGMTDISTSRNLEVLPTFTTIQYGDIDPTVPEFVNGSPKPDAGVNLKYGLTSNLTADFTINPDFSQIESDQPQIEVNQRYPIFFSELRPFFLEGAEIFNIQAPVTFVHTRTIVDPDYGAKLTGKVGRFSLGLLTANDRAPGKVDDPADPAYNKAAQTFIVRGQYDLRSESNVGVILTDREFLDSYSRVVGLDSNFRLSPTITGDFRGVSSFYKGLGESEVGGHMLSARLSQNGRNVSWSAQAYEISPDFDTDVGFVRRTDQRTASANLSYRFWPQGWIINWGPRLSYGRTYDFDGTRQDDNLGVGLNFSFARNIMLGANFGRDMERFGGIDFWKTSYSLGGQINTSRTYSFGGQFSVGDEIYYSGLILGHQVGWNLNGTLRPMDRLQTNLSFTSSRLTDPANGNAKLFDVKILRATTNLQFTSRLGLRNITEYNTQDETFGLNVLFNYQVNSGTVFYLGYDDHYQQADLIRGDQNGDGVNEQLYFTNGLRRTNRAIFVKLQYLLRY